MGSMEMELGSAYSSRSTTVKRNSAGLNKGGMEVEEDEEVVDMFVWYSRYGCGRRVDGVDERWFEVGAEFWVDSHVHLTSLL